MIINIDYKVLKMLNDKYQSSDASIQKKIGYSDCIIEILKLTENELI